MKKVIIEIVTMDLYDNKVITKKEIEYIPGKEIKVYSFCTDNDGIELNNNLVTVESLVKEFGEIFSITNSEGEEIIIKNHPDFANDWRSISTRAILNYEGINRIAGEPKNEYYYGLKVQNIKVNDIICVTSGMTTSRVLEVKTTAKGITLILDNNRNRSFKNDTIVIVANQGLKQVDINIIDCVNDGCLSLMFDDIILNNNTKDYQNVISKSKNKLELYKIHLDNLGLLHNKEIIIESEEIASIICDEVIEEENSIVAPTITHTTNNSNDVITNQTVQTITNQNNNNTTIKIQTNNLNDGYMIYLTLVAAKTNRVREYNSNSCNIPKKYNKLIQALKEIHNKHFDTENIHKNMTKVIKQNKLNILEIEIKELNSNIFNLSHSELLNLSTKIMMLADIKRDLNL